MDYILNLYFVKKLININVPVLAKLKTFNGQYSVVKGQ